MTGKHTIFGEAVEGANIVDKISNASRDGRDKPHKPVTVESAEIERVS